MLMSPSSLAGAVSPWPVGHWRTEPTLPPASGNVTGMGDSSGTRHYDRSMVAPLGAYPAKQCPVRLQFKLDSPPGVEPSSPTAADVRRQTRGFESERDVFAELEAVHGVTPVQGRSHTAVEHTLAAITARSPLILGGELPIDEAGRRIGRPDILVLVGDGYVPVDVKNHRVSEPKQGCHSLRSTLRDPRPADALPVADTRLRRDQAIADGIQLAHYWRMMDAHHLLPSGQAPLGGVLDSDRHIWWLDLAEATWTYPTLARLTDRSTFSLLEIYDHEFSFRLDVAAHTMLAKDDPKMGPKVLPVRISECDACEWSKPYCSAWLEEADHVSLLPSQGWLPFLVHRERGNLTRRAVAEMHVLSAEWLVAAKTAKKSVATTLSAPDDPLTAVKWKAFAGIVDRLLADGVATVGDLRDLLDEGTLSYEDAGNLGIEFTRLIDEARAAVSGRLWLRRGADSTPPEAHAVEVDIDMENGDDGAYLWGLWIEEEGREPHYEAIDTYLPLTNEQSRTLTARLAKRIEELRGTAHAAGGSLALYHWSPAEFRPIAQLWRDGVIGEEVLASLGLSWERDSLRGPEWIDLEGIWRKRIVSGRGTGLKQVVQQVAPDFRYDVDEPGGDQSLVHYDQARAEVSSGAEPADSQGVQWLRHYNEGDVQATWEIRHWLRENLIQLASIETRTPQPGTND